MPFWLDFDYLARTSHRMPPHARCMMCPAFGVMFIIYHGLIGGCNPIYTFGCRNFDIVLEHFSRFYQPKRTVVHALLSQHTLTYRMRGCCNPIVVPVSRFTSSGTGDAAISAISAILMPWFIPARSPCARAIYTWKFRPHTLLPRPTHTLTSPPLPPLPPPPGTAMPAHLTSGYFVAPTVFKNVKNSM